MKKLIVLLATLFPLIAGAETMSLKYDGYWEGIKAGEVTLKNIKTGGNYVAKADADTTGIVKTLTNFYSHTTTAGTIQNGEYKPSQYDSKWQTKKNAPHIIVNYNASGEASEIADPPENRKKRPFVEQEFKQNSIDPVTVIFAARQKIREIIAAGINGPEEFHIKVFDARRVFAANFIVIGYENVKIGGNKQKLLHITLNRTAIAGFNGRELEKIKNFNPTFDIWLDSDYIPVLGYGQAVIGHTEMRLASKCLGDSCGG